jgi:hypothetical protein
MMLKRRDSDTARPQFIVFTHHSSSLAGCPSDARGSWQTVCRDMASALEGFFERLKVIPTFYCMASSMRGGGISDSVMLGVNARTARSSSRCKNSPRRKCSRVQTLRAKGCTWAVCLLHSGTGFAICGRQPNARPIDRSLDIVNTRVLGCCWAMRFVLAWRESSPRGAISARLACAINDGFVV